MYKIFAGVVSLASLSSFAPGDELDFNEKYHEVYDFGPMRFDQLFAEAASNAGLERNQFALHQSTNSAEIFSKNRKVRFQLKNLSALKARILPTNEVKSIEQVIELSRILRAVMHISEVRYSLFLRGVEGKQVDEVVNFVQTRFGSLKLVFDCSEKKEIHHSFVDWFDCGISKVLERLKKRDLAGVPVVLEKDTFDITQREDCIVLFNLLAKY